MKALRLKKVGLNVQYQGEGDFHVKPVIEPLSDELLEFGTLEFGGENVRLSSIGNDIKLFFNKAGALDIGIAASRAGPGASVLRMDVIDGRDERVGRALKSLDRPNI